MQSLHATDAQATGVTHANPDDSSASPVTDQRRAGLAATALGVLAVLATVVWWRLIPNKHFDPLEMLPVIIATQVVGAMVVAAWLALSRPATRQ